MPIQVSWRRSVFVKLGGMVVALLVLLVLYQWANVRMLSATEGDAAAADHAGRVRMQAYQLQHLTNRAVYETDEDARARLVGNVRNVTTRMERRIEELRDGAPALGIPAARGGPMRAKIDEAAGAWHTQVRSTVEQATRATSREAAQPPLELLDRQVQAFVARIDEVVQLHQTAEEGVGRNILILQYLYVVIASVVAAFALGLVGNTARRVKLLSAATERITGGETSLRVDESGADEIATLGKVFNMMTATLGTTLARASAQEAEARTILNSTADGIIVIDERGTVTTFNGAAAHMFGYQVEDVAGRNISMLMPAPHREQHDGYLARYLRTGEARVIGTERELEGLRRDGTTFPIALRVREMSNNGPVRADGRAFVGVVQDITERKNVQEQFRQAQKLDAVGRLAAGVAHDFNNLLTVILGLANDLIEEPRVALAHEVREDIEEIRKAGDRAAALTRQLLAFSRKQIVRPTVLNLNAVIASLDMMLRRLIEENIEFRTVLAPDLGYVRADASLIEQVLVNLVVNARDAMPAGGQLTVETANVELDGEYSREHISVTPGRYAMVAISDTGVGMSPEVRARLFEPFFTTKEIGKGTGLGLATVYGIVKQSGGNIWVYSEPSQGATFKIYLPLVDDPAVAAGPAGGGEEAQSGSETVLLAEDEDAVRTLAKRTLLRHGYTVLEARHAEEALRVAAGHAGPIHLLLTDVVMPGMSGRLLAQRLAERHPGMKVLYMSGYTDNAIVHHGVLEPGISLLEKPFTPKMVLQHVREVLDTPADGAR